MANTNFNLQVDALQVLLRLVLSTVEVHLYPASGVNVCIG